MTADSVARQNSPETRCADSGATKRPERDSRHLLTPLRTLTAIAPSGGEITLIKYSEGDRELSFYRGLLSATEDMTFWRAKCAAERPGVNMWNKGRDLLLAAGWAITEEIGNG